MPRDVSQASCCIRQVIMDAGGADLLVPPDETPLFITIGIMAFGALGMVFVRTMYQFENRKRARETAAWDVDQVAHEATSEERRGDQRRTFIYGL